MGNVMRALLFDGAYTWDGTARGGERLRRGQRWLFSTCMARWLRGAASQGKVLAVGDSFPPAIPQLEYHPLKEYLTPELFADLHAWAAWIACGWYKGPGTESRASRFRIDGINLLDIVEYEVVTYLVRLLTQIRIFRAVADRHPAAWYVDYGYQDLARVLGDGVTRGMPAWYAWLDRITEPLIWRRRVAIGIKEAPATLARACPGKTTLVLPNPSVSEINIYAPIIRELQREDRYDILLFAPNPGVGEYARRVLGETVRQTSWNDYWEPATERLVAARYARYREAWDAPDAVAARRANYTFAGLSLVSAMEHQNRFFYGPLVKEALRLSTVFATVLDREQPGLVLFAQDKTWTKRGLADVARWKNVPTMVHLFQMSDHPETVTARLADVQPPGTGGEQPRLRLDIACDRATLMGKDMSDRLLAGGCPPEKLTVTGSPLFDGLAARRDAAEPEKSRPRLGLPTVGKLILFATQPPTGYDNSTRASRDRTVREVCRAVRRDIPDAGIIIKPHPAETDHAYALILAETGVPGCVAGREADMYELLGAADLLLTFFSFAAVEAMYFAKPVVVLHMSGRPEPVPFASSGAALGISEFAEISPVLRRALEPAGQQELRAGASAFVRNQVHLEEGAAARIADVIRQQAAAAR